MPNSNAKWRFDLIEVALVAGFVAVASWAAKPSQVVRVPSTEAQSFAERYGSSRNSEHEEEWLIRDFFKDKTKGYFVDVGANHFQHFNNTYYLEVNLGWSGIAVEPLREFEADYKTHRPLTLFRPFFVSNVSDQQAKMFVLERNPLVTSADPKFTARYGDNAKEVSVPTITLNDLLDRENVKQIDFVNMDIELWEPKALAGFDVERFRPALVCIEAHPEVRQEILNYFHRHGYVVVGRYLRADTANLYFTPADTSTDAQSSRAPN